MVTPASYGETPEAIASRVASALAQAILAANRTKASVSEATDIPYATLHRKLKGGLPGFTVAETFAIAEEVGADPLAILAGVRRRAA